MYRLIWTHLKDPEPNIWTCPIRHQTNAKWPTKLIQINRHIKRLYEGVHDSAMDKEWVIGDT